MKRKVSAANLSIAITFLLILLSFGFGYRSYSQAEQRVVSDLNQALQRTVLQNKGLWLNADTIQTYAKLQEVIGAPRFCKRFPQSLYRSIVHHRIERCLYPFAAYTEKELSRHRIQ